MVSSQSIVKELLQIKPTQAESESILNKGSPYEKAFPLPTKLVFANDVRETYMKANLYEKQFLGEALLMGMTFLRLGVLRCPHSITLAYSAKMYKSN